MSSRNGIEVGPSGNSVKDQGTVSALLACARPWCGSITPHVQSPGDAPIRLERRGFVVAFVCSWHCASRTAIKQELAGGDV